MELFSEIYGAYFRIVTKALAKKSTTKKELDRLIADEGFGDSALFLPEKLIPSGGDPDWGLLCRNTDGSFSSVLTNKPVGTLTLLQKRWLSSLLLDPKTGLFLSDKERRSLEKLLDGVPPLYVKEQIRYVDRFSDGDPVTDEKYRKIFGVVFNAVKSREILEIDYFSGHGSRLHGYFLPFKIEYSPKNDKFRVFCFKIKNGIRAGSGIMNIGRIYTAYPTGCRQEEDISPELFFAERKTRSPAVIRITSERSGAERFLTEFAAYEKRTERDPETGITEVKLWYDRQDETEVLIRLLSFGPVLEILSPPSLRQQAAERVKRQAELIFGKERETKDGEDMCTDEENQENLVETLS